MQTEHLVDDTSIADEQAAQVRRTAVATEQKIGQEAPATPPPSATDGTLNDTVQQGIDRLAFNIARTAHLAGQHRIIREIRQLIATLSLDAEQAAEATAEQIGRR
jgi:hypothetical protein